MLWYVVVSAFLLVAHADDFGISRRTPAQPQQQPGRHQVLPYVVRIIAFDSSGQSFGTGSYVGIYGEYGVVLTNQHVVCETKNDRLVHVHFPSGFSSFGAVIATDQDWDLALIAISKPPQSIPTLRVSSAPSKPGDPLWIVGFGSGEYREAAGKCVRYMTRGSDGAAEIMEVSVSARKGDSGGPILNQKGELAGVLFGSDMIQHTAGSYSERVNRFLMETKNKVEGLPVRPETHFATVEKNGPAHTLHDSRNAAPQSAVAPRRSDVSGSSASSFGVRSTSSSRRYVPPISTDRPPLLQQQAPQRVQESSATTKTPLTSLIPMQLPPIPKIEQAAWAESSPKFGRSVQPAKLAQAAFQKPLAPISEPIPVSLHNPIDNRYQLKLSADRNDLLFTLFMALNVGFAVGLTYFAVRLLR